MKYFLCLLFCPKDPEFENPQWCPFMVPWITTIFARKTSTHIIHCIVDGMCPGLLQCAVWVKREVSDPSLCVYWPIVHSVDSVCGLTSAQPIDLIRAKLSTVLPPVFSSSIESVQQVLRGSISVPVESFELEVHVTKKKRKKNASKFCIMCDKLYGKKCAALLSGRPRWTIYVRAEYGNHIFCGTS